METEPRYCEVKEIEDDPAYVNQLIDGGGWDLLKVATRCREVASGRWEDVVVYVVGEREDARSSS